MEHGNSKRSRRALTAVVVGLLSCAMLMGPVLFFGSFALRTSLLDLRTRLDSERGRSAELAGLLAGSRVEGRADELRDFVARAEVGGGIRERDRIRLGTLLASLVDGRPDIGSAAAFDRDGVMLARYPDDVVVGQSFADRDYFRGAVTTDRPYVSEAFLSRAQDSPALVALAMVVRGDSGAVTGVVNLTLRPSVLLSGVEVLREPGRELLLLDHRSQVIGSTAARVPLSRVSIASVETASGAVTSVDAMPRLSVAAAVPGAAWTLLVLDDPAALYATQLALSRQLGIPLLAVIVAAGLLAAALSIAYLLLQRERERLAAANAGLRQLNAEVEAATSAKSDFLASMSHELRTPLNAVLGFSEVLQEQLRGTLTDRQSRYLANIRSAGQHLLELINDVLDLSKVEAGRLQLRREALPLPALLEPVVASAAQLAADCGVRFDAPEVPDVTVLVDSARTRQVLLNLLSNAVKFTPAGGDVELRVGIEGADLRFDVTDTGIGIPPDKRDRVFGMFERLHEGRSAASGTGLGLAITKRLVELQHGSIDFVSQEGRGTRFWVVLEGVVADAPVGPRLLVVEDDRADAELLSELAREAGLRVEVAPTAASATAAVARSAPTAVILDLRLPDRRGDEVLRSLKADRATAHIPVLVVTVEDDDGHARLLGAADHMTKPIDCDAVRRWLASVRTEGAPLASAAR